MTIEIPQEGQDATTSTGKANDSLGTRSLEEVVRGVLEQHDGLCMDDENDRRLLLAAIVKAIMPEQQAAVLVDQPIPTNWVHKDDLVYCRPDLAEKIRALDESEVKYIAGKIGDALQETYWIAMGITLDDYLGSEHTLNDEDEEDDDDEQP